MLNPNNITFNDRLLVILILFSNNLLILNTHKICRAYLDLLLVYHQIYFILHTIQHLNIHLTMIMVISIMFIHKLYNMLSIQQRPCSIAAPQQKITIGVNLMSLLRTITPNLLHIFLLLLLLLLIWMIRIIQLMNKAWDLYNFQICI